MKSNTIHELVLAAAAQRGGKVAFRHIYGGKVRQLYYRDLARLSFLFAEAMALRGLERGDRLVLCADNSPEWVLACLGALRLGLTVVPVDSRSRQSDIEAIAEKVSAKLFVLGRLQYGLLSTSIDDSRIALLDEMLESVPAESTARKIVELPVVTETHPALIVFTSGTSGASKGVVLSHENILANVHAIVGPFDVTADDRLLSILPLSHMFEFTAGLIGPLAKGACIVYSRLKGPEHLRELLKIEKINVLIGVPAVYQAMLKGIDANVEQMPEPLRNPITLARRLAASGQLAKAMRKVNRVLLSSIHKELGGKIKFWAAGGAPVSAELVEQFAVLGIPVLAGYGLTEASPVVAANTRVDNRPGSVGRPLKGLDVRIVPLNGEPSEPAAKNAVGEIVVKGPSVMLGYYADDAATNEVIRDGWLHTGDLGRLDEDGFLHVTGRVKSTIVTAGGYNIQPEEIERELEQSPAIKEACVFGLKADGGEQAHAIIVPTDDAKDKAGDRDFFQAEINKCLADVAEYKRLSGWQVSTSELPRTRTNKVQRSELPEIYRQLQEAAPAEESSAPAWDADGEAICQMISDLMDPTLFGESCLSRVRPRSNISGDLGIDSFARLELAVRIEQYFACRLPEDALSDVQTVDELISLVKLQKRKPAEEQPRTATEVEEGDFDRMMDTYKRFDGTAFNMQSRLDSGIQAWPYDSQSRLFNNLDQSSHFLTALRGRVINSAKRFIEVYSRFEVIGADRLSIDPPYIIVANHTSHLDTLAIVASFPPGAVNHVHPVAAADTFFTDRFKSVLSTNLLNAVPFDRFGSFETSLRDCEKILGRGEILIIFPEGTRSRTGKMGVFRTGAARLSASVGCPVIPAFIDGAHAVLPKKAILPRPAKLRITFGMPIYPPAPPAELREIQDMTKQLREAVEALSGT